MSNKQFPSCVRSSLSLALAFFVGLTLLCTTMQAADVPNDPSPTGCVELIGREVVCEKQPNGTNKYTVTLTIRNLTDLSTNAYDFAHATVLPPAGFSPTFLAPSPNPIPPGGVGTITTCYYGSPGQVCFNIAVHNADLTECCASKQICLDLPSGFDFVIDDIRVERSPSRRVALRFPTQAGLRYQIEQAPTVLGPWKTSTCTSPDTTIDPQGFILGTGGDVTCHLERAPGERMQFFRGVESRE